MSVAWVLGHAGIPGNEITDCWAVEKAQRAEALRRFRNGRRATPEKGMWVMSLTFLKARARARTYAAWREEIIRRRQGIRSFRAPAEGEILRILTELRGAPKELASRFFQLALGHAMIAPFVKEKFKWIEPDICWWCGSGRQTREHLFKRVSHMEERDSGLWKTVAEVSGCKGDVRSFSCKGRRGFFLGWRTGQGRVARRPGNTSIRELMADRRFTEAF